MRVANIIENVKTAKTITQVCRVIVHPSIVSDILLSVDIVLIVLLNVLLSDVANTSIFADVPLTISLLLLSKICSSRLTLK